METKQRKVGRPKAPARTGPLVLGEELRSDKGDLEISERAAGGAGRVRALGREVVRHLRERGEIQDGRLRPPRDLPPRPCVAGRAAGDIGAGQGSPRRDAALDGAASRRRDSSIPTATRSARAAAAR